MSDAISELDRDPDDRRDLARNATGANRTSVAPSANANERNVDERETERQVLADQPTDESRWSKYFEEPRYVLLHGVCHLRDHQKEKK
jgi:hypothetical protein